MPYRCMCIIGLLLMPLLKVSLSELNATEHTPSEIERLIRHLGNSDFRERDRATEALDAIGESALELLRKAAKSEDAEVRRRAQGLVDAIARRLDGILQGHAEVVRSVAFSPDGHRLATGSDDKTIRIWNLKSRKEVLCFKCESTPFGVVYSPKGRHILSAGGEAGKDLILWDTESGKQIRRFEGHEECIRAITFSADGSHALTGGQDSTVRLWDVSTGKEVRRFHGHTNMVFTVALSPDGRYVASGSGSRNTTDYTARVWELISGKEVMKVDHPGAVWVVRFSPDSLSLLTGGWDMSARLLKVSTGREALTFKGHGDMVMSAAFTSDGKRLVTSSGDHFSHNNQSKHDHTVRLWQVEANKELRKFEGHRGAIECVTISPDGRTIASASWDKTIRLWRLSEK